MAALEKILQQVKEGTLSIEEASLSLRKAPFVDLGYAQVDTQRGQRQGIPEVIYGAGKTAAQIEGIAQVLKKESDSPVLITRLSQEKAEQIQKPLPLTNDEGPRAYYIVTPDGLEPSTLRLEVTCSIQLSYRAKLNTV